MIKQNDKLKGLLKLLSDMPEGKVNRIIDELYKKISSVDDADASDESVYALNFSKITACKHCGSLHIVKNGLDKCGHPRYLCRDCKKTFGDSYGTVVYNSHKNAETWKKYIELLLLGASLNTCAKACNISLHTSFVWRHKILNALTDKCVSDSYSGVIEIDEMYVRISYKGNHSKSTTFTMPRKACKRGDDNRAFGTNSKATVLCLTERDKGFYATVPCIGYINLNLLKSLFGNRISDDSIVLTDGFRAYNQFFSETKIEHCVLHPVKRKPTIKGAYHLNNVNALHGRFRNFLFKYNGVSTKYLNNYLALFLWLENNRTQDKEQLLQKELWRADRYISAQSLALLAPTPGFAPGIPSAS